MALQRWSRAGQKEGLCARRAETLPHTAHTLEAGAPGTDAHTDPIRASEIGSSCQEYTHVVSVVQELIFAPGTHRVRRTRVGVRSIPTGQMGTSRTTKAGCPTTSNGTQIAVIPFNNSAATRCSTETAKCPSQFGILPVEQHAELIQIVEGKVGVNDDGNSKNDFAWRICLSRLPDQYKRERSKRN